MSPLLVGLGCALVVLNAHQPMTMRFLRGGLDPSWEAVISEAHRLGLRFGSDVFFPRGPLASISTRYFQEENAWWVVLLSLGQAVFLIATLTRLLQKTALAGALAVVAVLAVTVLKPDTLMGAVPFLLAVAALERPERTSWALIVSGLLLSAALLLAKFSVLPGVVATCLVLDAVAMAHRRLPLHTVIAAASLLLLFVLAGGAPGDLGAFFQASLEASSGFTSAMSVAGPVAETVVWSLAAALLGALILQDAIRDTASRRERAAVAFARVVVFAVFLAVAFKTGFVRHDPPHVLVAWGAIVLATLVHAARRPDLLQRRGRLALFAAIALVGVVPGQLLRHERLGSWSSLDVSAVAWNGMRQVGLAAEFFLDPGGWMAHQRAEKARSFRSVRSQRPLPALDGSVDVIPSLQSELIASGLEYRPRPTIQEYTTYSASLIDRNRRFFSGPRAPKYLLFAPGSIDGRHPASAEGPLWPLFVSLYEPVDRVRGMLLLRRREQALEGLVAEPQRRSVQLESAVAVPPSDDPQFLTLDIQTTLVGRLLEMLYKPPLVRIVVAYSDGSQEAYRLIPAQAREGFVISPLLRTADEALLLWTGSREAPRPKRPVEFRVDAGLLGFLAYAREMAVSLAPLSAGSTPSLTTPRQRE